MVLVRRGERFVLLSEGPLGAGGDASVVLAVRAPVGVVLNESGLFGRVLVETSDCAPDPRKKPQAGQRRERQAESHSAELT